MNSFDPNTTYVGLDVHKDSIYVAALLPGADPNKPIQFNLQNNPKAPARIKARLRKHAQAPFLFCYEAGCLGFTLQRRFHKLGLSCTVIAPSSIPKKKGDKVKTDRRDAAKLARCLRNGDLSEVFPPTPEQESLRRLARQRAAARGRVTEVKNEILAMLLTLGHRYPGKTRWTKEHRNWLSRLEFNEPADGVVFAGMLRSLSEAEESLRYYTNELEGFAELEPYASAVEVLVCFKGIKVVQAMTLLTEIYTIGRFASAKSMMAYLGLTPREKSSGGEANRGSITKVGNKRLRTSMVQIAWNYARPKTNSAGMRKRRQYKPDWAITDALKAEDRLHGRYKHMVYRGKQPCVAVVAIARELAGFIWAALRRCEFGMRAVV